jgi:hypothetical protein
MPPESPLYRSVQLSKAIGLELTNKRDLGVAISLRMPRHVEESVSLYHADNSKQMENFKLLIAEPQRRCIEQ